MPETTETGPQVGFIPASEVPALFKRQAKLGDKRKAFLPPSVDALSKATQLYVFNVGPKRQESVSSHGTMIVPACPKGARHSKALILPGVPYERYNMQGNVLDVQYHGNGDLEDPGWDFACQVIGGYTHPNGQWEGQMLTKANSMERFGVGISRQWPPTEAEIEFARSKMLAHYSELANQAREAHAIGRLSSVVTADHYLAAKELDLTVETDPWLRNVAPTKATPKDLCPKCRKPYEAGTVVHDCDYVIDMDQYEKWVREGRIAGVAAAPKK